MDLQLHQITVKPCGTETTWIHQRGVWNYYLEEDKSTIKRLTKEHMSRINRLNGLYETYSALLRRDKLVNAQFYI